VIGRLADTGFSGSVIHPSRRIIMGALVIVVSADEQVLRCTEALLSRHGFLVAIASSFVEGHELLRSVTPDLLITDLRLDDYNGLQLATQCRHDHPDVAVIIMSSTDDWWAEGEAKRHGAAFIANPLENPGFLPCVQATLAGPAPARKPMRRWFRNPAVGVTPVHAANGRAQVVDISYGGVRLVFSGPRVVPATFDIRLPRGVVTVQARCVWTRSAADARFYCGAELAEASADRWRTFVDALQGRRTAAPLLLDVLL
jgi:DNA-binding response OmpR family regulator